MKQTLTIKKIAKRLGYSPSTISKAINDSPEINALTKKRILKYTKSHDYKPNLYALSLRYKKSTILGVILPDLKDTFFLDSLMGITEESSKNNYKIMVYHSCNQYKKEVAYANLLSESNLIDGLIYSPSLETLLLKDDSHIKLFIDKGIPVINIVKYRGFDFLLNTPEVKSQNIIENQASGFNVGKNAVKYLLKKN